MQATGKGTTSNAVEILMSNSVDRIDIHGTLTNSGAVEVTYNLYKRVVGDNESYLIAPKDSKIAVGGQTIFDKINLPKWWYLYLVVSAGTIDFDFNYTPK